MNTIDVFICIFFKFHQLLNLWFYFW